MSSHDSPLSRLVWDAESLCWLGRSQLRQDGLPQCRAVREGPAGDQPGRVLGLLQTLSMDGYWPGHTGELGQTQPGADHQGLGLQRLEHHQHWGRHLQVSPVAQHHSVFSQSINISSFELEGDSEGSQGATPYFEGRVVVMGAENNFYTMEMSSPLTGSVEVEVFGTDYQVMLVLASVPEFFGSYQTYGYQVKISKY